MSQASANVNLMIRAARKAARALLHDFGEVENLQVAAKGPGDFVSRADRRAEELIRQELTGARPNYGWLAEESTEEKGADPTRRWIVDPLDGTTNFLHGLPHWAISIALEHKGAIVAGVVFDPTRDELFVAEKGAGAYLNDRRLRVSGRRELIETIFATGIPFGGNPRLARSLQELAALTPRTAGIRRSARRRSISPTWRPGATTASGSPASTPGTWRRASCSSARRGVRRAPDRRRGRARPGRDRRGQPAALRDAHEGAAGGLTAGRFNVSEIPSC